MSSSALLIARGPVHEPALKTDIDRIHASRQKCKVGDYVGALSEIFAEGSSMSAPTAALTSEVVRVHIIRGDRASASKQIHDYRTAISPDDANPGHILDDILALQAAYLGVSAHGDLVAALQVAETMWKKHGIDAQSDLDEVNEAIIRIGYYVLEIWDLHRRYGQETDRPSVQPTSEAIQSIVEGLISAHLGLEALEIIEYFVDKPVDLLCALTLVQLQQDSPFAEDVLLRLAKIQLQDGDLESAETTLDTLDEMEGGCLRATERRHVLRLRYLDVEADKTTAIRLLLRLTETFQTAGDFDVAMETAEYAAEVHSQLSLNQEMSQLGFAIHDTLRTLCERSGDVLSGIQFEFRRCDMVCSTTDDLVSALTSRDELLALPICSRLPFFERMHKRQCLEYLIAHRGERAKVHAATYLSYCCRLKDDELISEAENLHFRALVEPTRASDEVREALLTGVAADLEPAIARDKVAGRHGSYVEKVLLLAEVLEELRAMSGEEREDSWPAIADMLHAVETTCSGLRCKPDGLVLLMLEVSYLNAMFTFMATSHDAAGASSQSPAEDADEGSLQALQRQSSCTGIDTRKTFEPTRFMYDLYLAVQSGSVLSFRSVTKNMNSEAQRLRKEGHPLEEARYLLCRGMLCYVLATGSYVDEEQLVAAGAGFDTKVDGLLESLKCFEESLALESRVNQRVHSVADSLESLIAFQASSTGSLQALLYDTALTICYELDDNDLTWAWAQKGKAYAYSTWLRNHTGGYDQSRRQAAILPKAELSFQDMLWVSSASARTLVFVDWIAVHLDPDPRLLLLVLQFTRDDGGTSRRLSLVELDISVDDVEEKARNLSTARLDSDDWRRALSSFAPLIQPLEELSEEGDVLVLSPTGCLHNVPLHALDLKGEPLIERNAVAYVPSLQVLVSCLGRLEAPSAGAERQPGWSAAVFGAYDDDGRNGEVETERSHIYESLNKLGSQLDSAPVLGSALDAESFARGAEKANLIHFHGHGWHDEHHILRQGLILGWRHEQLTLHHVAALALRSPHVNLIACESGVQDFSLGGDEPLGLLSAFLAGGAASVIAALWPIQSTTGRIFTETFFEYFLGHSDARELGPVVNLADALRHTCRSIRARKETATPYHWAPFVLYGAWFCSRKPVAAFGVRPTRQVPEELPSPDVAASLEQYDEVPPTLESMLIIFSIF
ncbi:CHAT domain-containing protein [Dactylonectria estremocensis]|uniref:CHAT domain-containing protein n=1 Tax=Dactylonectria estremocensis TaxID=1079267 RepID=A0A9P9ENK8_9HYPO|nr:CHAT domain-containing protein [Dactylonectria estremocensis]